MMIPPELMAILDDQELGQLQTEQLDPQLRYDMGGAAPIANPVSASMPKAGGNQMPSKNGALARLMNQMRVQQGIRPRPGLDDHSDQFASDHNWHESGGV